MKIAVPVTKENQIDSHFGHCESYGVFTISEKNEITEMPRVSNHLRGVVASQILQVFLHLMVLL